MQKMDSHSRFDYPPVFMTSSLTFYSDTYRQDINGLPVARIHYDPKAIKFQTCINSIDLSTYYLPDLINLLNTNEEGYKLLVKRHKKATGDVNMIDYDELRQILDAVDGLEKMSRRLQVVGTSAQSVLNDYKKLNTGVCIEGHVTNPDNLYLPSSNFMDNKVFSTETVAEVLVNGIKPPIMIQDLKTRRYSLSGSIIYLLIYKRHDEFDYMVFMSEEPIGDLIRAIKNQVETSGDFDFIYTVLARTNTEEESVPYIQTVEGVYFKDVIVYCNETQFSAPVLRTLIHLRGKLEKLTSGRNSIEEGEELGTESLGESFSASERNFLLSEPSLLRDNQLLYDDDNDYQSFGLFD